MRIFAFIVAVFAAGCGGDTRARDDAGAPPPTDGGGGASTVEAFCEGYARAVCDGNQRCCTDPARVPATLEACLSIARPQCLATADNDAWTSGAVVFDPSAVPAVIDAIEAAAAACLGVSFYRIPPIGHGTRPAGSDCTVTADDFSNAAICGEGLGCAIDYTTYAGTCETLAVLGASCGSDLAPCSRGLYCDIGGSDQCEILRDDGEACTSDLSCWSAYCDVTCQPRPFDYCL